MSFRTVDVSAMDTQLYKAHLQIERKQFTFDLKREGGVLTDYRKWTRSLQQHHRPRAGLEQFRDSINEMIRFNKPPVVRRTIRSLLRRKAGRRHLRVPRI